MSHIEIFLVIWIRPFDVSVGNLPPNPSFTSNISLSETNWLQTLKLIWKIMYHV